MKLLFVACVVVVAQANILTDIQHVVDKVGDGVSGAAHTVVDGVDTAAHAVGGAAHTVIDGVDTAAHAVGGAMTDVGNTLGSLGGTFGDVWNVVKDPLKEAGTQILIQAGTFALEQGVTMALNALAAGKRATTDEQSVRAYLKNELADEYGAWLNEIEQNIKGSKSELAQALSQVNHVNDMPEDLKKYVVGYTEAVVKGDMAGFVSKQADKALQEGITQLKERLQNRILDAINKLAGV